MKKIILIAAIAFIGCNKAEDSPQPLAKTIVTTPSIAAVTTYDFEGNWDCYDWVVDEISGATHHRRFIFSNQDTNSVSISLNDYFPNGSMIQLISNSGALIDSNYFNESVNPQSIYFKGVMTTDSTLMVYQYLGSDTSQVKEFKRL